MSTNISDLKQQQGKSLSELKPKDQVKALLQQNRAQIVAALPSHVKPERMMQVALTAALQTPKLLDCYTPSLFGALVKCTQLGLEPNNALGHAYLVPFKNTKKKRMDVQVIIGYRGLISLARRSAEIQSISAYAVKVGDEFSYEYGLDEHLRHIPCENPGAITHFYAYAKYKDGGHNFEVLTNDQVQRIMRGTQSKGEYGPWKDHYEEMGRKTAVRRLSKYLPMQIELAEAVAIDETGDRNVSQEMDRVLEGDFHLVTADDSDFEGQGALEDQQQQEERDLRPSQQSREAKAGAEQRPANVDSTGEVYDPEKHATGHDGKPVFNKDGSFRARRGTAKAGDDDQQQQQAPAQQQQTQHGADAAMQQVPPEREPGSDDDFALSDDDFKIE